MTLSQISTPLTKEQAYALVDAVMASDELAITASAHEDESTGEWIFEATCTEEPDIAAFSALARDVLCGDVTFTAEALDPEVNWVARSLEGLKPVEVGGFFIHGSHDTPPAGPRPIAIRIDAAQAFGTGHHETTTGCLEAIDRVLKCRRFNTMVDIGTGTGVLAIALAKRTRLPVLATDIDPVAVETTAQNAEDNGVGRLVIPLEATGLSHRQISEFGPYDLIVANILAHPLVALSPGMRRIAAPGAVVILSGILNTQATRVINAYGRQGIVLAQKIVRKEWTTLILQKR